MYRRRVVNCIVSMIKEDFWKKKISIQQLTQKFHKTGNQSRFLYIDFFYNQDRLSKSPQF